MAWQQHTVLKVISYMRTYYLTDLLFKPLCPKRSAASGLSSTDDEIYLYTVTSWRPIWVTLLPARRVSRQMALYVALAMRYYEFDRVSYILVFEFSSLTYLSNCYAPNAVVRLASLAEQP